MKDTLLLRHDDAHLKFRPAIEQNLNSIWWKKREEIKVHRHFVERPHEPNDQLFSHQQSIWHYCDLRRGHIARTPDCLKAETFDPPVRGIARHGELAGILDGFLSMTCHVRGATPLRMESGCRYVYRCTDIEITPEFLAIW
jgi:hypothetical protein